MDDGGPLVTARRVAAHRLGFSRVPAAYGVPAADEALAADVAAGFMAPANRMHDYLAARTSFFDRIVVSAIDRGVRQVVVGAAGYDGRAFRYAKPGVRWFEVDHPVTQRDKLERLERLGIAAPHVRFIEADFTRDPVADRLRAAGLEAGVPSLFLLEGVAVYLEPAVLETVLEQFRQVAARGSRLAISVSLSREHDQGARDRFQAAVAALGERPGLCSTQARPTICWRARAGGPCPAAMRKPPDASACARSACSRPSLARGPLRHPRRPSGPSSPGRPRHPRRQRPGQALCPCRRCCPRRWSRTRSSSTTKPSTASRTARPITGRPATATATATRRPGWCHWSCGRTACDTSPANRSPSANSRPARAPEPIWTACGAGAISPSTARPGRSTRVARARNAVLRATGAGLRAREVWLPLPGLIEQRWRQRFTSSAIDGLQMSLEALAAALDGEPPPLFRGLEPYPDNWRAAVRRPSILPHYPMVLHRGGYPDGS